MNLDPRLQSDSTFVTDLGLCQVRLSHNAAFPWIILIPRLPDVTEIIDLSPVDQQQLTQEIDLSSRVMRSLFAPTKLNVASLGNVVPQLHIHVIARSDTDPAWPGPVWNSGVSATYSAADQVARVALIREAFEATALTPLASPLAQMHQTSLMAAQTGFDWDSPFQVAEKVREELEEVLVEARKDPSPLRKFALQDELGDLLFAWVNLARHCHVDPDIAARTGLEKFQKQYARFEAHLKAEGLVVRQMSLPELTTAWRACKDKSLLPFSTFPLETERLILRPVEDEDATSMALLANDMRVAGNLRTMPYPYTLADAHSFIEKAKEARQRALILRLAIIRKADHAFIGGIGLESDTIGYWLGHNFWGQGYGTEAARALVTFAFTVLEKPMLKISALVDNAASRRIIEKLGFTQTEIREGISLAYEGTRPEIWYALSREDFMRRAA